MIGDDMANTRKQPDWVDREYGNYGSAWWDAMSSAAEL